MHWIPDKYQIIAVANDEMDKHDWSIDMFLYYDIDLSKYVCECGSYNFAKPVTSVFSKATI